MNLEERILYKAQKEIQRFKLDYQRWQTFYQRKIKDYNSNDNKHEKDRLDYKVKVRPKTPTKIKPFFFHLDERLSIRGSSCQPLQLTNNNNFVC